MQPDLSYTTHTQAPNLLLIPEIVQWIYRFSQRKDGYYLARTCSHLFNSLIPLVWENVNGMEQLLALIVGTEVSVDTDENIHIIMAHKSMTNEDMRRFTFYAPFVKFLNPFKIEKYYRYRLQGWKQLLTALGSNPPLPNLRAVSFNTHPTTTLFEQRAWFMLLLSPSLQNINLTTTSSHRALTASAAELFFISVSATLLDGADPSSSSDHSTMSSKRTVTISTDSADIEDICWHTTVRVLSNLSKVFMSISTLGAGELSTIGQLPKLESLELDFDISSEDELASSFTTLNLPDTAFPRLRHFGLTNLPDVSSFRAIWNLNPLISHLTSITLHFNKYRWMNVLTKDQIMFDFISPIGEKSPALVELAIHPPEYEWNEAESSGPMFGLISRLPLARLWFAPMVPLHISIPHNMGRYPLLTRLELTTSWVEVTDIKALATLFPNLEYLAMQITVYPEDFQSAQSVPTSLQSIVLCVMSVFLEEDTLWDRAIIGDQLARLLYSLWPNARYISKENDILQHKLILPWATTRLF